ncbi:MAG: OmpA family protein [Prolixibacteraceae bacterium]|nr:OmpA family protein [Prolixibacteraceae bacterium]
MNKIVPVLLIIILMPLCSFSQTDESVWGVSVDYGTIQYKGELDDQLFKFDKWQGGYGLELSRYISPSFNFGVRGGYNFLSAAKNDSLGILSMKGDMYSLTGNIECKFANGSIISKNAFLKPYIKIGGGKLFGKTWGKSFTPGDSVLRDYSYSMSNDWMYSASVGTKIRITKNINAFIELTNLWVTCVGMDGAKSDDSKDRFLRLNAGISFALGEFKDSDNDGVSDRNDQCPRTPDKVVVDDKGCPLDSDEDGIPDFKDDCPLEIGSIKTNGCPDSDNDGVADKEDDCPDEKGPISNSGCPLEEKPKTESPAQPQTNTGYPQGVNIIFINPGMNQNGSVQIPGILFDSDMDGVSDNIDRCPGVKGTVENFGCPDSIKKFSSFLNEEIPMPISEECPGDKDCDGISDINDLCPDKPGSLRNNGCPIEHLSPKWKREHKMTPVHFITGKSNLTDYSKGNVDKLIDLMQKNNTLNVWLFGHTDPVGSEDFNEKLSEERLMTIVNYMTSKGISKERIYTMAFGESFPASLGKSEDDLMRNRRVEFYLFEFK